MKKKPYNSPAFGGSFEPDPFIARPSGPALLAFWLFLVTMCLIWFRGIVALALDIWRIVNP